MLTATWFQVIVALAKATQTTFVNDEARSDDWDVVAGIIGVCGAALTKPVGWFLNKARQKHQNREALQSRSKFTELGMST